MKHILLLIIDIFIINRLHIKESYRSILLIFTDEKADCYKLIASI